MNDTMREILDGRPEPIMLGYMHDAMPLQDGPEPSWEFGQLQSQYDRLSEDYRVLSEAFGDLERKCSALLNVQFKQRSDNKALEAEIARQKSLLNDDGLYVFQSAEIEALRKTIGVQRGIIALKERKLALLQDDAVTKDHTLSVVKKYAGIRQSARGVRKKCRPINLIRQLLGL